MQRARLTARIPAVTVVDQRALACLERSLAYLRRGLVRLDDYEQHWPTASKRPLNRLRDKVVTECALQVALASRVPLAISELGEVAATLAAEARSPRRRGHLVRFPQLLLDFGMAHSLLDVAGFPDEPFERLVATILDSDVLDRKERLPCRHMEVQWLRRLRTQGPAGADVVQGSVLLNPPSAYYMHRLEHYAFTHAVMYATDFGRSPLAAGSVPAVDRSLQACLASALVRRDFDLACEFVACLAMLPGEGEASHLQRTAIALIATTLAHQGHLRPRGFSADRYAELDEDARDAYEFTCAYHPTMCAGMWAAIVLAGPQRHENPPEEATTSTVREQTVHALVRELAAPERERWWEGLLGFLACGQADAPLVVLDLAAIEAGSRNDLAQLDRVERAAEALGTPHTPTRMLGREFAARQRALAASS